MRASIPKTNAKQPVPNTVTTRRATTETTSLVESPLVTMYYDGDCPLCGREVAHYRRLDKLVRIQWVDINVDRETLEAAGIGYEEAMARLHVREESGGIQTGAWAFAAVWERLPYYRWLARIARALNLLPAIDAAYMRFANWRFRRRRCKSGSCASP